MELTFHPRAWGLPFPPPTPRPARTCPPTRCIPGSRSRSCSANSSVNRTKSQTRPAARDSEHRPPAAPFLAIETFARLHAAFPRFFSCSSYRKRVSIRMATARGRQMSLPPAAALLAAGRRGGSGAGLERFPRGSTNGCASGPSVGFTRPVRPRTCPVRPLTCPRPAPHLPAPRPSPARAPRTCTCTRTAPHLPLAPWGHTCALESRHQFPLCEKEPQGES